MTDIAKSLREKLKAMAVVAPPTVVSDKLSDDGTRKWLIDVGTGNAVETVFIPEDDRGTLCVSTQAGCALDCAFCSTGKQGFNRNLTVAEIIGQLWLANQRAGRGSDGDERRHQQRGADGHGRAAANFDNTVTALAPDARRQRLRPVAPPRHGFDLRHRAGDGSPARRMPGGPGGVAACAERQVARPAGADQPEISAQGTDGGLPALSGKGAARFHHLRVRDAGRRQRFSDAHARELLALVHDVYRASST